VLAEQDDSEEVSLCNLPNLQRRVIIDNDRFSYYVIRENRFAFEFEEKLHDD